MAVNEKALYANRHVTFNGKVWQPGEQIHVGDGAGRMPEYALRHAQDNQLTTESHAEAERFKGAEQHRREDVARQIEERSEKRDTEKRVDRRS